MFDKKYRLKTDGSLYTEQEFRALFPNVGLPSVLSLDEVLSRGADPILQSPAPTTVPNDETTYVDGVELIDGKWFWKWTVVQKGEEEKALEVIAKRDALVKQIDVDVDAIYGAVMGNRSSEYALAEEEALAYKAVDYTGTSPLTVRIWGKAKAKTNKWAADDIIATAAAWRQAQIAIRDNRLTMKEAARAATTHALIGEIALGWSIFTTNIKAALGL